MPTCSQAKILTNLESGIQKRQKYLNGHCQISHPFGDLQQSTTQLTNENYSPNTDRECHQQNLYAYDQRSVFNSESIKSVHSGLPRPQRPDNTTENFMDTRKQRNFHEQTQYITNKSSRGSNARMGRRISIDELPTCQFEPSQQKSLHKVPIIFDENQKKSLSNLNEVPSNLFYNNSQLQNRSQLHVQQKIHSIRNSLNMNQAGSDGEDNDLSNSSDDYNCSDKSSGEFSITGRNQRLYNQKRPTARRSIDCGQLKKNSPEDSKIYMAARRQEIVRRNSLLNQNQNVLSTHFPKIALEIESINANDNHQSSQGKFTKSSCIKRDHGKPTNFKDNPMNAKRLLALASIRPSVTFHKTMTAEEILVLKKYYEILKPKIPHHVDEVKEVGQPHPTLMYDTAKIKFGNLQNLKNFLETHKKAIECGDELIEYDVNNEGAPSGFVLRNAHDNESVTKFPSEINDAFFAFTCINETADKIETKLGEANLFRVLNWNDTAALCSTNLASKKPSLQSKLFQSSSSLMQSSSAVLSSASSSSPVYSSLVTSSSSNNSELSFEYIKNLSSLVSSIVPSKLAKELKSNAIDISTLPGGASTEVPSFEELGINLPSLIAENTGTHDSNNLPPIEYQSQKLKVTAYKALKEKVNATKTMWFNGPPERKPFSVIFEYCDEEIGHEKILEEVSRCLKNKGHVISLEYVPRSVQLGSVYVENQWILTLDSQKTKFFAITNGVDICGEQVPVQSYDEFIFSEFEKFIRVEKYKHLIKNHEKAVQNNHKKYAMK